MFNITFTEDVFIDFLLFIVILQGTLLLAQEEVPPFSWLWRFLLGKVLRLF